MYPPFLRVRIPDFLHLVFLCKSSQFQFMLNKAEANKDAHRYMSLPT